MKVLYFILPYLLLSNQLFANQLNVPQAPTINTPKNPTLPHIDIPRLDAPHIDTSIPQSSIDSKPQNMILRNLIHEVIQKNMQLNTACIPQQIAMQNRLHSDEVENLGIQLELTTTQYKDNLLRLQNLVLKPANKEAQKQFVLNSQGLNIQSLDSQNLDSKNLNIHNPNAYNLDGILMVMAFLEKGIKRHTIALSPNYIQIDNALLENTPQVFRIFQTYFCHARTFHTIPKK